MFGKTRKNYGYYTCQPQLDRVDNPEAYVDHPRAVYVREYALPECVQTFFNERVFGPDRTVLLRHQLRGHAPATATTSSSGSPRSKTIAEVTRRQNNLLGERESCSTSNGGEVADAWVERLRHRFAELEHKHRTKNTELDSANERTTMCAKPNQHATKHDRPGNNRKVAHVFGALGRTRKTWATGKCLVIVGVYPV
ncbi:hypothetical protein [Nocardia sp. NPDC005998]|uniref:hypothetical protein n=1 Tax=Nocardia sp. NPDC005998 TaxID=3156894 RepID=UPI0033BCA259